LNFETREDFSTEKGKQIFVSALIIDNQQLCESIGNSKKEAEQNVAKIALKILEI
jgi:dsRNA-specific ribonuclease